MIKIENISRRTVTFPLGRLAQQTQVVRAPVKSPKGGTAMARRRVRVSSEIRIPAGGTVDHLPSGQPITEAMIQLPVIQRALRARPAKIRIIQD